MTDFYCGSYLRWDWCYDNPNKTALLLGEIALLSLLGTTSSTRWSKFLWPLFLPISLALAMTFSRGGALALLLALVPILWHMRGLGGIAKARITPILIFLIIAATLSIATGFADRMIAGMSLRDPSASNRMTLWTSALSMIADSSSGWGSGRAGACYMAWYQPVASDLQYRSLVNSHLTWLCEWAWPSRLLYLGFWSFVFFAFLVCRRSFIGTIAFAEIILFFWGCLFSSCGESPSLWLIPVGVCVVALCYGSVTMPRFTLMKCVVGAMIISGLCLYINGVAMKTAISHTPPDIVLGNGVPRTRVIYDPGSPTSRDAIRCFRAQVLDSAIEWSYLLTADTLPRPWDGGYRSVLVVEKAEDGDPLDIPKIAGSSATVTIVSPRFVPPDDGAIKNWRIYVGAQSRSVYAVAWRTHPGFHLVKNADDFVPDLLAVASESAR